MNELPPPLPLRELTECQQLLESALEPWYTTFIVMGILAFIGGTWIAMTAIEVTGKLLDWAFVKLAARWK